MPRTLVRHLHGRGVSSCACTPCCQKQAGEQDPDLFFTDRPRDGRLGVRNREYLSLFAGRGAARARRPLAAGVLRGLHACLPGRFY